VHNEAVVAVGIQRVGNDFAEGSGNQTFIQMSNGAMHILFAGRNTSLSITLIVHERDV
jgi:hypothetical protein